MRLSDRSPQKGTKTVHETVLRGCGGWWGEGVFGVSVFVKLVS